MKRVLAIMLILATLGTLITVPATASTVGEKVGDFLFGSNQATKIVCGNSCILPFGMHRSACPKCNSSNYKVLSTNHCRNDLFDDSRDIFYQRRECIICGTRYKGPQFN